MTFEEVAGPRGDVKCADCLLHQGGLEQMQIRMLLECRMATPTAAIDLQLTESFL